MRCDPACLCAFRAERTDRQLTLRRGRRRRRLPRKASQLAIQWSNCAGETTMVQAAAAGCPTTTSCRSAPRGSSRCRDMQHRRGRRAPDRPHSYAANRRWAPVDPCRRQSVTRVCSSSSSSSSMPAPACSRCRVRLRGDAPTTREKEKEKQLQHRNAPRPRPSTGSTHGAARWCLSCPVRPRKRGRQREYSGDGWRAHTRVALRSSA